MKVGSVVVPASPVHKEKLEAEPVAKRKAEPMSDTMHLLIHRSLSDAVTSQYMGDGSTHDNTLALDTD